MTTFPNNLTALVDLATGIRWEQVAGDEAKLEELLVREMAASADPMTREIGSGLADGSMNWHTIATSSGYADYLNHSLDALRGFDFEQAARTLAAEKVETAHAAAARHEEQEHDDEVWRGFDKGHR
ncbi:MAG: hypothetical protein M3548_00205 [Actinomycetota bacterium]|nr:hypothetical protein [Actinomycetota bacterium]